jgi:hypothetical protein
MYLKDNGLMLSDAGAAFFQRELELLKSETYDVVYADLPARNLFPVNNEGGFGVTSITYQSFDKTGKAKIINGGSKDLPRADVGGREHSNPVREIGISYAWTQKEIAASAFSNRSIDRQRSNAANRSVEELVNEIAFFGNADHNLPGFLSNSTIPSTTVVNPGSGTEWVNKTPDEVYFDISDAFADVFEISKMKEKANTLLLPPAQWSYLASTRMAAGTDTTILKYLVDNCPYINSKDNVIPVNELIGAGAGSTDRMVVYTRDPRKLQFEIPAELQYLPAQEQGLEMLVPGWLSICGVVVYYPLSASFHDGI